MPPSCPPHAARRCRALAVAVAIGAVIVGAGGCGGDDAKTPKRPQLTAEQNKGIAQIGKRIQDYCLKGGASSNLERELDALLKAYRKRPTAVFKNSQGTESTMREVVSAVADELDGCGEEQGAKRLRKELTGAG